MILALTAQEFADGGKAWIEAFGIVANTGIAQFGILAAAFIGVWQNITLRANLKDAKTEINQRLDSQSRKIHEVALAQSPTNGNGHADPKAEMTDKAPIQ